MVVVSHPVRVRVKVINALGPGEERDPTTLIVYTAEDPINVWSIVNVSVAELNVSIVGKLDPLLYVAA
jgi:hypothetical protein